MWCTAEYYWKTYRATRTLCELFQVKYTRQMKGGMHRGQNIKEAGGKGLLVAGKSFLFIEPFIDQCTRKTVSINVEGT